MRAVFAVIGVAVAGAYGHQFDLFDAFADGEDQQRFVGQVEFLFDPLLVECADADAVQAISAAWSSMLWAEMPKSMST